MRLLRLAMLAAACVAATGCGGLRLVHTPTPAEECEANGGKWTTRFSHNPRTGQIDATPECEWKR